MTTGDQPAAAPRETLPPAKFSVKKKIDTLKTMYVHAPARMNTGENAHREKCG
jgi:hypothetical protein